MARTAGDTGLGTWSDRSAGNGNDQIHRHRFVGEVPRRGQALTLHLVLCEEKAGRLYNNSIDQNDCGASSLSIFRSRSRRNQVAACLIAASTAFFLTETGRWEKVHGTCEVALRLPIRRFRRRGHTNVSCKAKFEKILGVLTDFRKSSDWTVFAPQFNLPYSRSKTIPSNLDFPILEANRKLEEVVDVYWEVEGCCIQISDTESAGNVWFEVQGELDKL